MNNSYFISTGNADAERLRICNKIYNKETFKFLLESGLKSGMKVLELGCGFGHSAIWLAKQVLPDGVVYAIDISLDNLAIAEENAQKENIHNIKFICMDANDLVDKFCIKLLIVCPNCNNIKQAKTLVGLLEWISIYRTGNK